MSDIVGNNASDIAILGWEEVKRHKVISKGKEEYLAMELSIQLMNCSKQCVYHVLTSVRSLAFDREANEITVGFCARDRVLAKGLMPRRPSQLALLPGETTFIHATIPVTMVQLLGVEQPVRDHVGRLRLLTVDTRTVASIKFRISYSKTAFRPVLGVAEEETENELRMWGAVVERSFSFCGNDSRQGTNRES
ncbi:MAG: hypothetical protein U1F34_02045 [Gammaproteobacteria bacterium]